MRKFINNVFGDFTRTKWCFRLSIHRAIMETGANLAVRVLLDEEKRNLYKFSNKTIRFARRFL